MEKCFTITCKRMVFLLIIYIFIVGGYSSNVLAQEYSLKEESIYTRKAFSKPKKISINKSKVYLLKGKKYKLKITGTSNSVSWSSNKSKIATVNRSGVVTAKSEGKAVITARIGSVKKRCTIYVENPKLSKDKITLHVNDTETINLLGCKHDVEWKSEDPDIADVEDGEIIAYEKGETKITATVHNKTFRCNVKVEGETIDSISLSNSTVTMRYNADQTIAVATKPYKAIRSYDLKATSSDNRIVKVQKVKNGRIYLRSQNVNGKATITVKLGDKKTYFTVSVFQDNVTSLILSESSMTLQPGAIRMISYSALPTGIENKYNIQWTTSNSNYVKIERSSGKYVYIKAGNSEGYADITAKLGNKSVSCRVTVKKSTLSSLYLNCTSMDLGRNDTGYLYYTSYPSDVSNYSVNWTSSNSSIVKIENTYNNYAYLRAGNYTGTATITLTIGDKSVSCRVTVQNIIVSSLSLNTNQLNLAVGETGDLSYTVYPSFADSYYTVYWSSSNNNVAKIETRNSNHATIKAMGSGTARIVLTIGGKSTSCNVTVIDKTVTRLIFNQSEVTLNALESSSIYYIADPNGVEKYYAGSWSTNNDYVKITQTIGNYAYFTAGDTTGETFIYYKLGGLTATCKVKVLASNVNKVNLDYDRVTLKQGDKWTLTYNVEPLGSDKNNKVNWSIQDTNIAQIESQSGNQAVIVAKGYGTTTLTLVVGNATTYCRIDVINPDQSIAFDLKEVQLVEGGSGSIHYTLTPLSPQSGYITYSSNNPAVATVIKDEGNTLYIQAGIEGEAYITVMIGQRSDVCKVVVKKPTIPTTP